MIDVELTDVDWLEATVFTVIFLVDCIRVKEFVIGFDVNSLALVSPSKVSSLGISKFDFSRTTD